MIEINPVVGHHYLFMLTVIFPATSTL